MFIEHSRNILRAISIIVISLFTVNQLCWAYPPGADTLRPMATIQSTGQPERIDKDLVKVKAASAGLDEQKEEDDQAQAIKKILENLPDDIDTLGKLFYYLLTVENKILESFKSQEEKYDELVRICCGFNEDEFNQRAEYIIKQAKQIKNPTEPIEIEPGVLEFKIKKGKTLEGPEGIKITAIKVEYNEGTNIPKQITFNITAPWQYPIIRPDPEFRDRDFHKWRRIAGLPGKKPFVWAHPTRSFYRKNWRNTVWIGGEDGYWFRIKPFFERPESDLLYNKGFICAAEIKEPDESFIPPGDLLERGELKSSSAGQANSSSTDIPPFSERLAVVRKLMEECKLGSGINVETRLSIENKLAQRYFRLIVTEKELRDLLLAFKESQRPISELEFFLQEEILDYFLEKSQKILEEVKNDVRYERRKVHELFMAGVRVYNFPLTRYRIKDRKMLLAKFIVLHIHLPEVKLGSIVRRDEARRLMIKKILKSKDFTVFQPGLEAVIEVMAQIELLAEKKLRECLFRAFYRLLEDTKEFPRFAKALVDVLIKARANGVELLELKNQRLFFEETRKIIIKLANEYPLLRQEFITYLLAVSEERKELIALVQTLLKDLSYNNPFLAKRKKAGLKDEADRPYIKSSSAGTDAVPAKKELLRQKFPINNAELEGNRLTVYLKYGSRLTVIKKPDGSLESRIFTDTDISSHQQLNEIRDVVLEQLLERKDEEICRFIRESKDFQKRGGTSDSTETPISKRSSDPLDSGGRASVSFALNAAQSYEVKKELNRLMADYGFLAQEHAVVSHIRQLIRDKIYPDLEEEHLPRIEVLASEGCGVNSTVFANNTIVITPELLRLIEYEEELIFVLCHETVHMDREHFAKIEDIEKRNSIRAIFGLLRYQEIVHSDLIAMYMLEERGINPQGAITLFQRLRREAADWGPIHGTESDRLLNIETITYLKDVKGLSYLLTELPKWFSQEVNDILKIKGRKIGQITHHSKDAKDFEERRMKTARTADIRLVHQALPELRRIAMKLQEQLKKLKIDPKDTRSVTAVRFNEDQAVLNALADRAKKIIDLQTRASLKSLKFPLMVLAFGGPFLNDEIRRLNISVFDSIRDEFLGEIRKDFQTVLREIKRNLFEQELIERFGLTIKNGRDLDSFIGYIFVSALELQAYDTQERGFDFRQYLSDAHKFVSDAKTYAEKAGLEDFDDEWLWTEIAFRGIFMLFDLSQNKDIRPYLMELKGYGDSLKIDYAHFDSLVRSTDIVIEKTLMKLSRQAGFEYFDYKKKAEFGPPGRLVSILIDLSKKTERVDTKFVERFLATGVAVAKETVSRYNLDEIAEAIKEIRGIDRRIAHDVFILTCECIEALTMVDMLNSSKSILTGKTPKERIISYLLFLRAFMESDFDYCNWLNDFLGKEEVIFYSEVELSWSDLDEISKAQGDVSLAEERFGVAAPLSCVSEKIDDIFSFKEILFTILYRKLVDIKDAGWFFNELDMFLNRWPLLSYDEIIEKGGNTEQKYGYLSMLDDMVRKGMAHIGQDELKDYRYNRETMKRLFMLSFFSRDIFVKTTLQEYLLPQLLRYLSFDEAVSFLENDYLPQRRIGFMRGWEYLIEEKAETTKHLDMLTEKVLGIFKVDQVDTLKSMGDMVGIDAVMENIFKGQQDLLSVLLKTARDDRALKNLLFSIWWRAYRYIIAPEKAIFLSGKSLPEWSSRDPIEESEVFWYLPLENLLNFFYRMDYKAKYVLLRKLLTGKGGVLTTKQGRKRLLDEFIGDYVGFKEDETYVRGIIEDVLGEFIVAAQDDQLYFVLYPLLINRIANPPREATPWQELEEFRNVVKTVLPIESADKSKKRAVLRSGPHLEKRMLRWIYGYDPDKVREEESADNLFLSVVPEEFQRRDVERLSPIELTSEVAQRLGEPGVICLQLLGQFIELPQEYESEFMDVYDSMVGQSRLSAYQTIKRECPDYVKRIKRFGKRVGGGSQMTVYEVVLEDGTEEVVKVINPNAEYFSEQSLDLLEKVLTELAQKNEQYKQVLPLLDDLRQWIYAKLHDKTFIEDDKQFRNENNGYKPKGFRQGIFVPKSKDSSSPLVIREQLVKGKNLTEFKPIDNCNEQEKLGQQEAMSMIARNYLDQIFLAGFSSKIMAAKMLLSKKESLVHSDVHPGNFRVLPDGRVAILDRNAFIKLTPEDRRLLFRINECNTTYGRLKIFMDYLLKQPGNEDLNKRTEAIISEVMAEMPDGITELESITLNIVVKLKRRGVKIPLRMALLIKNLNGLKRLAQRVGFKSLRETLEFEPGRATVKASRGGSDFGLGEKLRTHYTQRAIASQA